MDSEFGFESVIVTSSEFLFLCGKLWLYWHSNLEITKNVGEFGSNFGGYILQFFLYCIVCTEMI